MVFVGGSRVSISSKISAKEGLTASLGVNKDGFSLLANSGKTGMFVIEEENVGVFQPSVGRHRCSGLQGYMEACALRLYYTVDHRFGVRCRGFGDMNHIHVS